jgi:hypothetical protein
MQRAPASDNSNSNGCMPRPSEEKAACAAVSVPTSPPPAKVRPDPAANPIAFGRVVCLLSHALDFVYLGCVPISTKLHEAMPSPIR